MNRKHDPIEDTSEYKAIEQELYEKLVPYREKLLKEAEAIYEEIGVFPTISHRVWQKQKEILLYDYGMEWKTPVEMNPDIIFD